MNRFVTLGAPLTFTLLFTVNTVGCSSDDSSPSGKSSGSSGTTPSGGAEPNASTDAAPASSGGGGTTGPSASLPCQEADNDSCDPTTSYCIQSLAGTAVESGLCAPLPADCESCDCFEEDAPTAWTKANPGTDNCSGTLSCDASSSGVTITCES